MKRLWIISPLVIVLCLLVLSASLVSVDTPIDALAFDRPFNPEDLTPHHHPTYEEMNQCLEQNKALVAKLLDSEEPGDDSYIAIGGLTVAFFAMLPSWIALYRRAE